MNLSTIAALLAQTCPINAEIDNISIDTRTLSPGSLFVAIQGERFDGHAFLHDAAAKGAVAAIVQKPVADLSIPQLVVEDTLIALSKIAAGHRQSIHCPVIAITGSNGKTTTKEMIAAILPQPAHATQGNFNNHIGAPLSVLQLKPEHRYAVFELGANHPGEIAHTVAIVHPQVTLINNIAPAHVEGFGSIDGVARAKGEIYQGLTTNGTAIVNDDDAYAHFWDDLLLNKHVLRFSLTKPLDIYAQDLQYSALGCAQFNLVVPMGNIKIQLQVPGEHNVRNALAAAACCYAVGIDLETIQQGLNNFTGVKGRLTIIKGKQEATIIDDTYNANLRSVLAALEVLAQRPGEKIFVFGDMGELGAWAEQHHQEVGHAARRLGINQLMSCGPYSKLATAAFGAGGAHYDDKELLVKELTEKLGPQTVILVKGSRSSAMEKIVYKLLN
ncbi:MAG: UDP-N-acetylmuramoyl-tripeptide--D-alanyl-D-alanine ligase [Legionella sp. 40-6]|nr:UDP-N-acetylmuramoyl-tripeptide--D-alanyl-D-alanine ligase [Legionella sp.]OJY10811.1 MAG: UDP-N-acetylmuramoyl-tripeptide--D-alanyl-D-alanine ligase [Legionella sp. 40-6]